MADIRLDNVPAATANKPNLAISPLLDGAIPPSPPRRIAIDERFANPHRAKETIAFDLSESIKFIYTNMNKKLIYQIKYKDKKWK